MQINKPDAEKNNDLQTMLDTIQLIDLDDAPVDELNIKKENKINKKIKKKEDTELDNKNYSGESNKDTQLDTKPNTKSGIKQYIKPQCVSASVITGDTDQERSFKVAGSNMSDPVNKTNSLSNIPSNINPNVSPNVQPKDQPKPQNIIRDKSQPNIQQEDDPFDDSQDLQLRLTNKLAPFLTLKKRFKVVFGGRSGTKSQSIADILIYRVATEGIKVLCCREFMNSISDSVHSLIAGEIKRMGVPGFHINANSITHEDGGEFKFRGLARNPTGIKSFFGFTIFWVEEASTISYNSLKALTPTLRMEGSEAWFSLNLESKNDPFSKRFINPYITELRKDKVYQDELHYIVWTNYDENPWMPESLEEERKLDKERLSKAEYNHIWLGEFYDTIEDSIIKQEWVDVCVDAHIQLGFEGNDFRIVGHDPADSGQDAIALCMRNGSIIEDAKLSTLSDVNEGLDWALDYSINHSISLFVWDSDGMGQSLKRQVRSGLKGEGIDYIPFHGGGTVEYPNHPYEEQGSFITDKKKQRSNKQTFKNLRAQKYWELRNRIYNTFLAITKPEYSKQDPDTLISFSSKITDLDQLLIEICKIPRVHNPNGMIQIMDKTKMKKMYQIESPNLADSLMMSLMTPPIEDYEEDTILNFTSPW